MTPAWLLEARAHLRANYPADAVAESCLWALAKIGFALPEKALMTDDEKKALEEIEKMVSRPPTRTHRQIAELLGISHGTVQNIERRALAKLRKYAERGTK